MESKVGDTPKDTGFLNTSSLKTRQRSILKCCCFYFVKKEGIKYVRAALLGSEWSTRDLSLREVPPHT